MYNFPINSQNWYHTSECIKVSVYNSLTQSFNSLLSIKRRKNNSSRVDCVALSNKFRKLQLYCIICYYLVTKIKYKNIYQK